MNDIVLIEDQDTQIDSFGSPCGRRSHTCGYCSSPGQRSEYPSSHQSAGLSAKKLTCDVYQKMIDRGWRRSGTWCYKPNLRISCCPLYTIKLDALAFKPSKSQRKIINRWTRYVLHGRDGEVKDVGPNSAPPHKKKGKEQHAFDLVSAIHEPERIFTSEKNPAHQLDITLEPSTYTKEKFDLYLRYQCDVHNDRDNVPSGFKGFLVNSPLRTEDIPYPSTPPDHLPKQYGSYHQMYRLDGELIAMAVLDILPKCVSSVYFMYDKKWDEFSFGKLSAFREISLAREIHEAGISSMSYLYMGYYVYSCQKMKYKGEYAPSFLADPETFEWYPLETCILQLEKNRYACFSNPDHSIEGEASAEVIKEDEESSALIDESVLKNLRILLNIPSSSAGYMTAMVPLDQTNVMRHADLHQEFEEIVAALGNELAQEIVYKF